MKTIKSKNYLISKYNLIRSIQLNYFNLQRKIYGLDYFEKDMISENTHIKITYKIID